MNDNQDDNKENEAGRKKRCNNYKADLFLAHFFAFRRKILGSLWHLLNSQVFRTFFCNFSTFFSNFFSILEFLRQNPIVVVWFEWNEPEIHNIWKVFEVKLCPLFAKMTQPLGINVPKNKNENTADSVLLQAWQAFHV